MPYKSWHSYMFKIIFLFVVVVFVALSVSSTFFYKEFYTFESKVTSKLDSVKLWDLYKCSNWHEWDHTMREVDCTVSGLSLGDSGRVKTIYSDKWINFKTTASDKEKTFASSSFMPLSEIIFEGHISDKDSNGLVTLTQKMVFKGPLGWAYYLYLLKQMQKDLDIVTEKIANLSLDNDLDDLE